MKKLLAVSALATFMTLGLSVGTTAEAVPLSPAMAPLAVANGGVDIVPVAQGCGPGGFRDGYGRCMSRRPPPRRYCPPGMHRSPRGCRPNF